MQGVLLSVSEARRRQLLQGVSSLFGRVSSKSPIKVAILEFISAIFSAPALYLTARNSQGPAVLEGEASLWLQVDY